MELTVNNSNFSKNKKKLIMVKLRIHLDISEYDILKIMLKIYI